MAKKYNDYIEELAKKNNVQKTRSIKYEKNVKKDIESLYEKKKKTTTKKDNENNEDKKVVKKKLKVHNIMNFFFYLLAFILLVIITVVICKLIFDKEHNDDHVVEKIEILDLYKDGNNIIVELSKDGYCSTDKNDWIISDNKKCTFVNTFIVDKIYAKSINDEVVEKEVKVDFSYVEKFDVNKEKIILAVNGKDKIDYGLVIKGNMDKKVIFESEDESIVEVDQDGVVTGKAPGETNINVKFDDKVDSIKIMVSNLIIPAPEYYDDDKEYLECNIYSEKDNDILDEILKFRITEAGYKTRAGAVAAARFIALEFPYKINYFAENGRYPGVDGEGRYYHEGLYLNSSRYENLTNSSHGPGVWGCYIFSDPAEKEIRNGFDCSGFISWVLKNGGFAPGDIGAGISPGVDDLTDLGKLVETKIAVTKDSIKVGDLLSGDGVPDINPINGGHIAMVVGYRNNNYYVAEELWWGTGYVGVVIREYSKEDLIRYFYWQVDMDEFYGEDGNLTNYWSY